MIFLALLPLPSNITSPPFPILALLTRITAPAQPTANTYWPCIRPVDHVSVLVFSLFPASNLTDCHQSFSSNREMPFPIFLFVGWDWLHVMFPDAMIWNCTPWERNCHIQCQSHSHCQEHLHKKKAWQKRHIVSGAQYPIPLSPLSMLTGMRGRKPPCQIHSTCCKSP